MLQYLFLTLLYIIKILSYFCYCHFLDIDSKGMDIVFNRYYNIVNNSMSFYVFFNLTIN
jgi:hypothetical protein